MVSDRMTKVLLVDDNLDTLDLLEMYLYREYEIITAGNGFDGFNVAIKELPDLVITDIMMPVKDGIRLFNDLKRLPKTAGIPVVAMTAFLKKITRKSLLNMGFKGVVSKPVDRERLLGMITRVLMLPDSLSEVQATDETG